MASLSFVYSPWLYRNEAIFKGAKIDTNHIFDLCVLRLSWWCKALWSDVTPAITDVVASPIRLSTVQPRLKIMEVHGWIAPVKGSVKFNTDGAIEGSYGEARIEGYLRDKNSKTLLYFSMSAGVNNIVSTEILAIKEALRLYNYVKGSHSYTVVFDCDNQSVVGWLQHPHLAPANIKEEIIGCIIECKDLDCRFQFVSREGDD
ncbi:hypothetical protein V6N11_030992 [Hibiscus sabdariffa]|uniref:RNase H type-1 domain-containing protein n=2 Tax=Hibiscus sabdariffa TaxID=183260 RepID=A0ABR2EH27_9ROSI